MGIKIIVSLILFIILLKVQCYYGKSKRRLKKIIKTEFLIFSLFIIGIILVYKFNTPKLKLIGNDEINIALNEKFVEPGYDVTPKNKKYDVSVESNVDSTKVGTYNVKYSLKTNNRVFSKIRKINVVDNISPEITLKGANNLILYEGDYYNEPGFIAVDNYDGNITDNVVVTSNVEDKVGEYEVNYSVLDSSGNKATATRKVKILDKEKIKGVIYLTFDDGPSSNTTKILDILKNEGVKATFFLVNFNSSYNDIVKRIYDEGHTIGIHSYTHNYKLIYSSVNAYFEDLNKMNDRIKTITGSDTKIIRFPGGSSNTISSFNKGIMSTLVRKVTDMGYHYFDWNVDSSDAWSAKDSTDVYNNVMNNLRSGSNIVLMHDLGTNKKTVDTLEKIIEDAKEKGYVFENITMNTKEIHHGINN